MKTCFRCGLLKEVSEFYAHPGMKDGHLNKCKECAKADVKANHDTNPERQRSYDRIRNRTPERRQQIMLKNRRKRQTTPGFDRAHNMVRQALCTGLLVKPQTCSRCPATERIQAHHDDYAKPLEVMWLCPICHAARHVELGRVG